MEPRVQVSSTEDIGGVADPGHAVGGPGTGGGPGGGGPLPRLGGGVVTHQLVAPAPVVHALAAPWVLTKVKQIADLDCLRGGGRGPEAPEDIDSAPVGPDCSLVASERGHSAGTELGPHVCEEVQGPDAVGYLHSVNSVLLLIIIFIIVIAHRPALEALHLPESVHSDHDLVEASHHEHHVPHDGGPGSAALGRHVPRGPLGHPGLSEAAVDHELRAGEVMVLVHLTLLVSAPDQAAPPVRHADVPRPLTHPVLEHLTLADNSSWRFRYFGRRKIESHLL